MTAVRAGIRRMVSGNDPLQEVPGMKSVKKSYGKTRQKEKKKQTTAATPTLEPGEKRAGRWKSVPGTTALYRYSAEGLFEVLARITSPLMGERVVEGLREVLQREEEIRRIKKEERRVARTRKITREAGNPAKNSTLFQDPVPSSLEERLKGVVALRECASQTNGPEQSGRVRSEEKKKRTG